MKTKHTFLPMYTFSENMKLCSICIVSYYRENIYETSSCSNKPAKFSCPNNPEETIVFNDSSMTGSEVKAWGGITKGGSMLPRAN